MCVFVNNLSHEWMKLTNNKHLDVCICDSFKSWINETPAKYYFMKNHLFSLFNSCFLFLFFPLISYHFLSFSFPFLSLPSIKQRWMMHLMIQISFFRNVFKIVSKVGHFFITFLHHINRKLFFLYSSQIITNIKKLIIKEICLVQT
jgi:hypothetical protein